MAQKFLIGYLGNDSGLESDVKPWLLPDNAFSKLENAYVFRGRVKKRFGSSNMSPSYLSSRLRMVATALAPPPFEYTTAGNLAVGQMFSVGSDTYTVTDTTPGASLLTSSANTAIVLDPTTIEFAGAPPATVYWYPSLPVMGLFQYEEEAVNDELSIAFDQNYAYYYDRVAQGWARMPGATWSGANYNFFWGVNYRGSASYQRTFWATNDVDPIRYWDGTNWNTPTLTYTAGQNITTARIIVQFKNRLILLNPQEEVGGIPRRFVNRCRYSGIGDPVSANIWRQDIPGNGSAIDAPTPEAIVTAQFLRDRLIVYFERSTYELVYTGNQINPFVFQKINTELGAESTFSQVPFDQAVLGFGQVGIIACSGTSVERIDQKIPTTIQELHNLNNGIDRVGGIRSYFPELVYWTYPDYDRGNQFVFPNRVLVYNYANNTWAKNIDSITCFGYFQLGDQSPGLIWGTTGSSWANTNSPWRTKVLRQRVVLAGNQQGMVNIIQEDKSSNAPSLLITNLVINGDGLLTLTIINHNLAFGDYIMLSQLNGITITNNSTPPKVLTTAIAKVIEDPVGASTPNSVKVTVLDGKLDALLFSGTYLGGGVAALASVIDIKTKDYNFFRSRDRNCYVSRINFYVEKTSSGELSVDYFIGTSSLDIAQEGSANNSILGSSILETSPYVLSPFEASQTRLWHPLYFQAEGESVQLRIYYSEQQMFKYVYDTKELFVNTENFELNAMIIEAEATSGRLQ